MHKRNPFYITNAVEAVDLPPVDLGSVGIMIFLLGLRLLL